MSSPRTRLMFFLVDVVGINVGFIIGYLLRYRLQLWRDVIYDASLDEYLPIWGIFFLSMLAMFWLDGVYVQRRAISWLDQMYTILGAEIKALFIVWTLMFLYPPTVYSRLMMLQAGAAVLILLGIARLVRDVWEARWRRMGEGVADVLIIGAGELGRTVMRTIVARPELGYRCVGFLDDDEVRGQTDIGRFPALGQVGSIREVLKDNPVDEVIITLPWSAQSKILDVVNLCNRRRIRARVVPSLLQINLSNVDIDELGGIPLIGVRQPAENPINQLLKRAFDLILAIPAFIALLPFMAIAALFIRIESPGSPIFGQARAGKDGKPFRCYKLRSMYANAEQEREKLKAMNEADGPMFKIRNDPRRTRVGRILRKLSIDELPQFWNVIIGDMSIIGPRPALMEEVAQYNDWQRERLRVKPGISGLWQISGRSELTFDEMCLLDVYYIENWSLSMDLKIALKTVPYLLSARGAY